jgi:predicted AlkP superfamily pyrophosphatase or phosphodiesterase
MHGRREKLSLFLFIDAFGWAVRQRHPGFLEGLIRDSRPLDTVFGYSSACDPSIISGRNPDEHGLWSSFYYDPDGCPYKWVRHLRFLPDMLFRRPRIRNRIGRLIRQACGFTGYFQIYSVPFEYLPLFNYAEKRRIWEPGGLPAGPSIFDRLSDAGIPYCVHDSDARDPARFEQLESAIRDQRIDFAYCSLGRLDALMHAVGNDHPDIGNLMAWYDERIRSVLGAAGENYREVSWYVFSDHGMHNVTEGYDLMADIDTLGLEWNRDYAAFYDATMARFWILDEAAREPLIRGLSGHPKGRILSRDELQDFGVLFEDGQYGDLIFLMHSGIQIAPGFMGLEQSGGMHGYYPADPDSLASISSNRAMPSAVTDIRHIHRLMLDESGLS